MVEHRTRTQNFIKCCNVKLVSPPPALDLSLIKVASFNNVKILIQGGSNMTGTNCM